MSSKKPEPINVDGKFYTIASEGPEAIDPQTGEVFKQEIPVEKMDEYVPARLGGTRGFVHKSLLPADCGSGDLVVPQQYSTTVAMELVGYILEGATLMKACTNAGVSYQTFCKWRRQVPEFSAMVDDARSDRAELIFDRMLEVAEQTGADKDEVALGRLRSEIYKHVAATTNEKFNPKQKIEAEHRVGVVALDTGIRRGSEAAGVEDEVYERVVGRQLGQVREAEGKKVDDEE